MSAPQWICPDCGETFDIPVTLTRSNGRTVVQFGDDAILAHLQMHEACYCQWVNVYAVCSETAIAYQRQPDPDCPVHTEEKA